MTMRSAAEERQREAGPEIGRTECRDGRAGDGSGALARDLRASILLVDDDERNLLAIEEALCGLGHEIVLARSGEDALRALLKRDFALILMDVQMPGLDGYQTAELVRDRDRCRHVPIIFITAVNKDDCHVFQGYSAGAVDYIFKPVDPVILKSKVSVFVDLFRMTEEAKRQAAIERRLLEDNLRMRAENLRAERMLRQKEEQYALVVRSLPIVLYTMRMTGDGYQRRFVSDNAAAITGFAAERFIEDRELWLSRIHEEDRERTTSAFASFAEQGAVATEYRWTCADGSVRHFLDQAVVGNGRGGSEILGTWLDITDRKQLELQLQRSQRLEAVGRLTGGIAHDFNNMLNVVIGSLDMLKRKVEGQSEAERFAGLALKGALRCSDLTRSLLAFARRQPLQSTVFDLHEFASGMLDILRHTVGSDIEVAYRAPGGPFPVLADPAHVEAALLNLVINARDAMPQGGQLSIELDSVAFDEDRARAAECPPGAYVQLAVRDTGVGMSSDVLARAFEPFFTTKGVGQGTGLGLSTTYGFLKQLRGHVEIESRVGEGTSVVLYFPAQPRDAKATAKPEASSDDVVPALPPGAAILVVEDEDEVREMAVTALTSLGFPTWQAVDGPNALDLLDQHGEISLLFTDIMMPKMDGRKLATEALRRRPGLKVLFTSGCGDLSEEERRCGEFLAKPYRAQDLASRIHRLVAGNGKRRRTAASGS
jgi:PAS domain S-box-containing protein